MEKPRGDRFIAARPLQCLLNESVLDSFQDRVHIHPAGRQRNIRCCRLLGGIVVNNIFRNIFGMDDAVFVHHNQALHEILHFPDIARPAVFLDDSHRRLIDFGARFPFAAAVYFKEVVHQKANVPVALAQRRKLEWKYIEPIVKVFTELPVTRGDVKIAMGRGDHPNIHVNRPSLPTGSNCFSCSTRSSLTCTLRPTFRRSRPKRSFPVRRFKETFAVNCVSARE